MKKNRKIGYCIVALVALLATACGGIHRTFRTHFEAEKVVVDYADSVQQFQTIKR